MSWTVFLDMCLQTTITIVPDNAKSHSWNNRQEDSDEDEHDDDESSCGVSCCASLHSCDADSHESDQHNHILKCRWETDSCPHSKCCPRQPCRRSMTEDPPAPPKRSCSQDDVTTPSSKTTQTRLQQCDASETILPNTKPKHSMCTHHHPPHPNDTRPSGVPVIPKQVFSKTA